LARFLRRFSHNVAIVDDLGELRGPMPVGHATRLIQMQLKAALVAAASCFLMIAAGRAGATSTPITLGAATNYGVFTGVGETTTINGGFKLTGNLGLATGYVVKISGTNSQTGTTYYDGSGTGGSWTDTGTYTSAGSVNQSMSQPLADAIAASNNAAALSATSGLTDQGGSITSSVTINALTNLSENVLDLTSVNLTNGTITFNDNGETGAKYIVNVTGAFNLSGTTIQVSGGASAADIIFNIEGTGQSVQITGGTTLGTLLVPNSNVTVGGGGTLTGELIAGVNNAGKSYTLTEQSTGYNITSFAYVPRANVPEPSSAALFGAGIAGLAALRRKLSRRG
jgi:hypothetical protein